MKNTKTNYGDKNETVQPPAPEAGTVPAAVPDSTAAGQPTGEPRSLPVRKPHGKSKIAALPKAQRETLEKWLFDENLSYPVASRRCAEELGIKICCKSLWVFYRQTLQRRTVERIVQNSQTTKAVVKTFAQNRTDTYDAVLKVVAQIAFEKAIRNPEEPDVRTIRSFTELLISARREATQAKRHALDREKWEFDVARTCEDHFTQLQAILAEEVGPLEEEKRLQTIRRQLFGPNLPD